ncbi:hypothetical protein C8R44DRAFT_764001 [Mycena epipterygia]|nr:hypothetical protein C8R44DRAFT_764001 [Mycena epipterygia]
MLNVEQAIELRSKCKHFRVLVIGRANAGKTTLLKKVCNSIEDPEIFSPSGEKISPSTVEGSAQRGEHDINNQMIFKSNRQFIFHDSRGFESGSRNEVEEITKFIAKHAATHELSNQLHAIWYCLPTDTNRPLLAADEEFFNTSITGKVPVIAIFTKFDGLVNEAFTELLDDGLHPEDARERETDEAKKMLTNKFEKPLMSTGFPPSDHVRLDDIRAETSNCKELIEKTANALNDDTLRLLFVSVQQNNIYLCIHYAVEDYAVKTVNACITILETKYSQMEESLLGDSGRSELVAAICICAEQTFTEASANEVGFSLAFAAALDAYLGSTLQEDVNREISGLTDQEYADKTLYVPKLVEIIKLHPLHIHSQNV